MCYLADYIILLPAHPSALPVYDDIYHSTRYLFVELQSRDNEVSFSIFNKRYQCAAVCRQPSDSFPLLAFVAAAADRMAEMLMPLKHLEFGL